MLASSGQSKESEYRGKAVKYLFFKKQVHVYYNIKHKQAICVYSLFVSYIYMKYIPKFYHTLTFHNPSFYNRSYVSQMEITIIRVPLFKNTSVKHSWGLTGFSWWESLY